MSRTLMAAARKHKTASEFVKKFLLPAFGAGRIPDAYHTRRIPPQLRTKTIAPIRFKNSKNSRTLIFSNIDHPYELISVRIQSLQFMGGGRKTMLAIGKSANAGPRIGKRDYNIGRELGRFSYEFIGPMRLEFLDIPEEAVAHWKTISGERTPFQPFPIQPELFEKLRKYQRCNNGIDKMMMSIRYLSGISSNKPLEKSLQGLRNERNLPLIQFYLLVERKNHFLKSMIHAKSEKDMENTIAETYSVSKRFAREVAHEAWFSMNKERMKLGIERLLDEIHRFQSSPH